MLNILRTNGINPSGVDISSMPNHKLVNDIRKLRAKLSSEKYKEAQAVYKKVIKPVNIAFIRSLYAQQYYMGINHNNPLADLDYLFGQYDNNTIENPVLYRLLKEHRLQRNLFKFFILKHFSNKTDDVSDKIFDKVIALLEARKDTHPDESEVLCGIIEKLTEKRSEFISIGLAKVMIGGSLTVPQKNSLDAVLVFGALAIDEPNIRDSFKKLIEGVGSTNSAEIVSRIDAVVADKSIPVENRPLFTVSILNPINPNFSTEKKEAVEFIKGLTGLDKKKAAEFSVVYLDKITADPSKKIVQVVAETSANVGVGLPATLSATLSATLPKEWSTEISNVSKYESNEKTAIASRKAATAASVSSSSGATAASVSSSSGASVAPVSAAPVSSSSAAPVSAAPVSSSSAAPVSAAPVSAAPVSSSSAAPAAPVSSSSAAPAASVSSSSAAPVSSSPVKLEDILQKDEAAMLAGVNDMTWNGSKVMLGSTANEVLYDDKIMTQEQMEQCIAAIKCYTDPSQKINISGDNYSIYFHRFIVKEASNEIIGDIFNYNPLIPDTFKLGAIQIMNAELGNYVVFICNTKLYDNFKKLTNKVTIQSSFSAEGCFHVKAHVKDDKHSGTYYHFDSDGKTGEIGRFDILTKNLQSLSFETSTGIAKINTAEATTKDNFSIQTGGGFYKKYLKYKSKYLQIK
jgi:hypothetical protein